MINVYNNHTSIWTKISCTCIIYNKTDIPSWKERYKIDRVSKLTLYLNYRNSRCFKSEYMYKLSEINYNVNKKQKRRIMNILCMFREKGRGLTKSFDKSPKSTEHPKKQSDIQKRRREVRLDIDCRTTKDGQLETVQPPNWYKYRFTGQLSTPRESREIKRTHI